MTVQVAGSLHAECGGEKVGPQMHLPVGTGGSIIGLSGGMAHVESFPTVGADPLRVGDEARPI